MSGSIVQAVARIKRNVSEFLTAESIRQACREAGHTWRERELGPAATVWAFMLQVLYGNTSCAHVVRLAGLRSSAEAYCAARARLPLAALQRLLERTTRAAGGSCHEARWLGHRTFFADGSGCSMPDTDELQNHFGQSGQQRRGCGFPQAHLLAMFDAVPIQRLSFVDALRWLAEASTRTPILALRVNPARPQRLEPRVRKRRPKEFPLMKSPRRQLRERLLAKRVRA